MGSSLRLGIVAPRSLSMFAGFAQKVPFARWRREADVPKYKGKIPVICEPGQRGLPTNAKKKLLVPEFLTVAEFQYIVHQKLGLQPTQTLYLQVAGRSLKTQSTLRETYDTYQADDGVLYMTYCLEGVFGAE